MIFKRPSVIIIDSFYEEEQMRTSTPQSYTSVQGTKLFETGKAVQFRVESVANEPLDETKVEWFPLSQVKSMTTGNSDGTDTLEVADWLLRTKELI